MNRCITLSILLALVVCLTRTSVAADNIRTVILSGTPAPGEPAITFAAGTSPVINNLGQTAFSATVAGPGIGPSNNLSLWSEGAGQLQMVVREGMVAPQSPPDYTFSDLDFGFPALNDVGTLLFNAQLAGPGAPILFPMGMWQADSAGLSLIARPGAEAPDGPPGVVFQSVSGININNNNQSVLFSRVAGIGPGASNISYWVHGDNGNELFLISGDSLPGVSGGGTISGGTGPADINDSGEVVFFANARNPANASFAGVWTGKAGDDLRLVALQGQHAPGTPSGISFRRFNLTPFNNAAGETSFIGGLQGTGLNGNDEGIWSEAFGGLHLVARKGDPAPGTSSAASFQTFVGYPHLNDLGQLAFRASLAGPGVTADNNDGMWLEDETGLHLLAREGDPTPGLDPGVVFGSFVNTSPSFNNNGLVAFVSFLEGPSIDPFTQDGLWVGKPGDLQLLLRTGDTIDVDNGPGVDQRVLERIWFQNPGIQGEGGFNDRQQLAFHGVFTDGSEGVFVLNLNVPEPSSFSLIAVLTIACGSSTSRREFA